MVSGNFPAGTGGSLRNFLCRQTIESSGIEGAVRRLCGTGTRLASGGGAGQAACVLARAAQGHSFGGGSASGPSAPKSPHVPRRIRNTAYTRRQVGRPE